MRCRPVLLSVAVAIAFYAASSAVQAKTIVFDDLNRGPASVLQVGDVTITAGPYDSGVTSMPATLANVGLGSATLGSAGAVDRVQDESGFSRESLSLTALGPINSVTVAPFFNVVGSSESVFVPFDISFETPPQFSTVYLHVTDASPIILNMNVLPIGDTSVLGLGLQQDFGFEVAAYLHDHPGATIDFGFTITSLDYTALVPEPGVPLLIVTGMIASLLASRGPIRKRS